MQRLATYYRLTKPGIVYSNVLATMAGFFLAYGQTGQFLLATFLGVVAGVALVIASACVLNNHIDRGIDKRMARTSKRATATGQVTTRTAIVYTAVLGVVGFGILALFTNLLTVVLGVVAYVTYIVFYGLTKRTTVHGTLVGAVAGGLPPAAGYTALMGRFDLAALLLFLVLVAWQMPHFYAIAMRRRDDYANAGIPVLPVVKGMHTTKAQIVWYTALFVACSAAFTIAGYTGMSFLVVMMCVGGIWLVKGIKGFRTDTDDKWALKMFLFSLTVLLVLCFMLAVGGLLP